MRLDRFTVRGDRLKQIDWIEVRLEDWKQDQKFRSALADSKSPDSGIRASHEWQTSVCFFTVQRLGGRVFRESPESDLGLQHRK